MMEDFEKKRKGEDEIDYIFRLNSEDDVQYSNSKYANQLTKEIIKKLIKFEKELSEKEGGRKMLEDSMEKLQIDGCKYFFRELASESDVFVKGFRNGLIYARTALTALRDSLEK